jgi:5-methylcytosine-specific restriction enzyme subunit McrC
MIIQVFEHDTLLIDQQGFTREHWTAFGLYNQRQENRYATVLTNGLKFCEYVGVIQIGNCTIEILPKIDRHETDKGKWQQVLLKMLEECHWLQPAAHQQAFLRIKHHAILEAYLALFVHHCEILLQQGLVKKYRRESSNQYVFKGKLLFAQHIRQNLIHQERFYTEHAIYDRDHPHNRILVKALRLVRHLNKNNDLSDRVDRLLADYPELPDITVSHQLFQQLKYDRKTFHYQDAIAIAAMILLNYRPDIRGGSNTILAIVFDMNKLWEEYVFRRIRKSLKPDWSIKAQNQKRFWEQDNGSQYKLIRPDIVVTNSQQQTVILDTKWKLPQNNIPADNDLKQMFVYNEYWDSRHACLLYPSQAYREKPEYHPGTFNTNAARSIQHQCSVVKISVLDRDNQFLDNGLGTRIVDFIEQHCLQKTAGATEKK